MPTYADYGGWVISIIAGWVEVIADIFGYTSLWLAIAADTGATLVVTANALQLLRPSRPHEPGL